MCKEIDISKARIKMKLIAKESISFDYDTIGDKITVIGSELATLRLCFEYKDKNIYHGKENDGRFYFELYDFSLDN